MWEGRSHTYYQEANRRHIFYHLPDSFKLIGTPTRRTRRLSVEFRSPMAASTACGRSCNSRPRPTPTPIASPPRRRLSGRRSLLGPAIRRSSRCSSTLEARDSASCCRARRRHARGGAILDVRLGSPRRWIWRLADFRPCSTRCSPAVRPSFQRHRSVTSRGRGETRRNGSFRGRLDDPRSANYRGLRENDLRGFTYARERDGSPNGDRSAWRDAHARRRRALDDRARRRWAHELHTGGHVLPRGAAASPAATVNDTIVFDLSGVR